MRQRDLPPSEHIAITEAAQLSILAGLMSARRWGQDEIKFQGGTSLHLVYGSPRFSEDLDFVLATDKGLERLLQDAATHVQAEFRGAYPGIQVSLKMRGANQDAGDVKNPRVFNLTLASPEWYKSIKIKVEFWMAEADVVRDYQSAIRTAALMPGRGPVDVRVSPALVGTAEIREILVDKLHALAARDYLKWRDVFDLWWLNTSQGLDAQTGAKELCDRFEYHARMYPPPPAMVSVILNLELAVKYIRETLESPEGLDAAVKDMQRWLLPSSALRDQIPEILKAGVMYVENIVAEVCKLDPTICKPPKPARSGPGW